MSVGQRELLKDIRALIVSGVRKFGNSKTSAGGAHAIQEPPDSAMLRHPEACLRKEGFAPPYPIIPP
jgi:hypothetical protein